MNHLKLISFMFFALAMVFVSACTPNSTPAAPAPQATASAVATSAAPVKQTASAPAGPAKASWEKALDDATTGAKREGTLVIYTSLGGQQRDIVTRPFEQKYGVRVESLTGQSGEITTKVLAEQRAGIYSADVYISGTSPYLQLRDKGALDKLDTVLVLPEVTDPDLMKKTWYFGEVPWGDKAHTAFIGLMVYQQIVLFNTNLVKEGEIKSYADLLNPKWKDKISLQDPRTDSMGTMWVSVTLENGDVDANFMRDLATKQNMFLTRDRRLQLEWIAQGKHAVAIAPQTATATEFIQLGAPFRRVNLGTPFVSGSTSAVSVMKSQPHPNATKLFVNWLVGPQGALQLSKAVGGQSNRLDVQTDNLDAAQALTPGLKAFRADAEDFASKRLNYYIPLSKEIFGN